MAPSPLDLALFHSSERELYSDLVRRLGRDGDRMKWVMALWLWFEALGHHNFIRHVKAYGDRIILRFVEEAEACLNRMAGVPSTNPEHGDEIPLTNALMTSEPIDLGFFEFQRTYAISGVARLYDNVCQIIFDDNLMATVAKDVSHPANKSVMSSGLIIGPIKDSANEEEDHAPEPIAPTPVRPQQQQQAFVSLLNPTARPWSPQSSYGIVDNRSMFITFSRGFPIARDDIYYFFTTRFGRCIEVVMIERAVGRPPMYGRIIFTSASMIALVLNGQRTAKFLIKGRHLWARMYIPR